LEGRKEGSGGSGVKEGRKRKEGGGRKGSEVKEGRMEGRKEGRKEGRTANSMKAVLSRNNSMHTSICGRKEGWKEGRRRKGGSQEI
jgi:hypothetical protein